MRCAIDITTNSKIHPLPTSMTVVAMGSRAPRTTLSLQAAFDIPDITVGNNIFDILIILRLSVLILLMQVDIPLMITASSLVLNKQLDCLDGIISLCRLLIYFSLPLRRSRYGDHHHASSELPPLQVHTVDY